MTNRYAIIENGFVVNTVISDAEFSVQNGWVECTDAGIGWSYDGTTFSSPPEVENVVSIEAPTKEQLMAELVALTAKIQALE